MKVWVIDGQSVYCQDGLPHRVFVPKEHLTQDLALDKDTALRLGVDLSLGSFVSYRTLIGMLDNELACELSYAIQLIHHKNTHQYCSRCGTPLHDDACKTCNHHSYPTVSPCIITAVIRTHPTTQKTQLLLAKHHRHAEIYTLIAGFVEMGETLEMAVCREVHEEVGLQIDAPTYFGSQAWPYPSNLMVGFIARHRLGDIKLQPDEIADARFFDLDDLPKVAPKGTIARTIIDDVVKQFG